jgi:hypothetical protein
VVDADVVPLCWSESRNFFLASVTISLDQTR